MGLEVGKREAVGLDPLDFSLPEKTVPQTAVKVVGFEADLPAAQTIEGRIVPPFGYGESTLE